MKKTPKLIAFSIIFIQLSGILSISPANEYLDGSLAYAQGENLVKKKQEKNKEVKKAEQEAEKEDKPKKKKGKLFFKSEEEEEAAPEKVKLPQQNAAISPETFRMIEMIEKKNTELKVREEELAAKEQQLRTLEENIRKDLEKIEMALAKSKEQLGQKETLIKENVASLIKVYSSMKPAEAANLIAAIDQDLALQIIAGMKSKIAGLVLGELDVNVAKAISEKMAGKAGGSNN